MFQKRQFKCKFTATNYAKRERGKSEINYTYHEPLSQPWIDGRYGA